MLLAKAGAHIRGIYISEKMISSAKNRLRNIFDISFETSDAADLLLRPFYSKIFSRFGVMFFSNPVGAFSNLRKGLRPSENITFIC